MSDGTWSLPQTQGEESEQQQSKELCRSASFIHEIAWLGLGEIFFNQEYITYWHRLQSSWQTHINKTQDYIAALDRTQTHLRLFQDLLTLYSLCSA